MGILYLHCGEFQGTPPKTEVLGSINSTGREMAAIGRSLARPLGDRHVFSNDNNLYGGLCLAILTKTLSPSDIVVLYRINGKDYLSGFDNDACLTNWYDGLFDQMEKNLLRLMNIAQAESALKDCVKNEKKGTIYLHCGEIVGAPTGVEILGSLTETQKNMTKIGSELTLYSGDRHVFSNSDFIFQGIRFAVADGTISPANVVITVHHEGISTNAYLGPDGELLSQPTGMFDQLDAHFIERLQFF